MPATRQRRGLTIATGRNSISQQWEVIEYGTGLLGLELALTPIALYLWCTSAVVRG